VETTLRKRTHVILPVDVVAGIDKLVGKRGRSAFLAEVAREEIQRLQQRSALRKAAGAWKDKDHPELKHGSNAWIRGMRAESEIRSQLIKRHRDRG
jgi:Arc/MetJ-type ribon-helix-helix transcriptional regulator